MVGEELRPVVLRVLDVKLELRRRSVKVKVDLLAALVIIESPLDNFTDAFHPLPHGLAGYLIQKGCQFVQEIGVIGKVIEMLIHPVLKVRNQYRFFQSIISFKTHLQNIQHSKLHRLGIFFSEPLDVLGISHFTKLVRDIGVPIL